MFYFLEFTNRISIRANYLNQFNLVALLGSTLALEPGHSPRGYVHIFNFFCPFKAHQPDLENPSLAHYVLKLDIDMNQRVDML